MSWGVSSVSLAAAQQLDHGGGGRYRFEATPVPAAAHETVFMDRRVADFPGDADVAVVGESVEDEARTDARADLEEHQVGDAAVWSPRYFGQGAEIGVVINKDRAIECFLQPVEDVDAHPLGKDGALRDGTGPAVDRARNTGPGAHHGCSVDAVFAEQFLQQPDSCGDALFRLVPQGQLDVVLGNHVVAQGGQNHPQVAASEVDSDGDSPVAVQPHVGCAAAGARGRFRRHQACVLHDFDDVGDGGSGEPGLP
ncbi:hypothetical protein ABIA52_002983 [Paenarthrobacter histidinolovorans]|uniref:Uncharacterized protein n=1 Tax=Paenarthrobacter histidinolovorans TaxID=43664 RepID=A0ABW8N966_9MICC